MKPTPNTAKANPKKSPEFSSFCPIAGRDNPVDDRYHFLIGSLVPRRVARCKALVRAVVRERRGRGERNRSAGYRGLKLGGTEGWPGASGPTRRNLLSVLFLHTREHGLAEQFYQLTQELCRNLVHERNAGISKLR